MNAYRVTAEQHREPEAKISLYVEGDSRDDAYCKAAALEPKLFESGEFSRERLTTVKIAEAEPRQVVGKRHPFHSSTNPRPCNCGCEWVEGLNGTITMEFDTDESSFVYARFMVPSVAGGDPKPVEIAYGIEELDS